MELIEINDFEKLPLDQINLIDVRPKDQFDEFHIPTATNIPIDDVEDGEYELDKTKPYYIICRTVNKAYRASHLLQDEGFDIKMILGGMSEYTGPVEGSLDGENPYQTGRYEKEA
jgi:rhodanese-related sulfurtransferase